MKRLVVFAALLIAGCSQRNSDVCSEEFPDRIAYAPPQSAEQVRANVKGCVSHWAARLSLGPDNAETVAKAAIAACREGFTDIAIQANVDGKPVNTAAFESEMRDAALFRAVQQRAGHCGVPDIGKMPPAEKGDDALKKERERDRILENMRASGAPFRSAPSPKP